MSGVVAVSGNPRVSSRTAVLAGAVGTRAAELLGAAPPQLVDLADFGHHLLVPEHPDVDAALDKVREADLLVLATPAYKGSYTGVLKVFLDRLPADALAGRPALTVITSGAPAQSEAADGHLRALLVELGATPLGPGLTVIESQLADPAAAVDAYLDRIRDASGGTTGGVTLHAPAR
jgi:FMN reductase